MTPLNRKEFALREGRDCSPAPVRIVHQGLGAFHRAHQAWYTSQVDGDNAWGIAAFTGRSPLIAQELAQQDGLFSLIERSVLGDSISVVTSISQAIDGADIEHYVELLAAPTTAIVTLTITEGGYRLTPDGQPDLTDALVVEDLDVLRELFVEGNLVRSELGAPTTALGRLVLGLEARRRVGAGPLAVVPCDNIPHNGSFIESGVVALASMVSETTAAWIRYAVSFVSTSVDRIVPRTAFAETDTVARLSGWLDHSPVVAEPFTDWVLCGDFPAGRTRWEDAGALFVDDIEPFEQRKLWLLNGAHSLLAYAGLLRGHSSVAEAIADRVCRQWVEELWEEADRHLPAQLESGSYRRALLQRFENSRIHHRLEQIAADGLTKLRIRILPVVLVERTMGRSAAASIRVLAAWMSIVIARGELSDSNHVQIHTAMNTPAADVVSELARLISVRLVEDAEVMQTLRMHLREFARAAIGLTQR